MVTQNGIIKKTEVADFENVRRSVLIAITLKKDDLLKEVQKSTGRDEVILITTKGQAIRFKEKEIREMGRQAAGVRGMRLKKGDKVIGAGIIKNEKENLKTAASSKTAATATRRALPDKPSPKTKGVKEYLLVVTENGYGKRTDLTEYRLQGRGGSGIKTAKTTAKTGDIVASRVLSGAEEDLIVISQKGQVIRTKISQVPKSSRSTQGVRMMRLDQGDKVASVTCI